MPKVIFFGTPQFSAKVLSYLITEGVNVVAAVTNPDRPKGRSRRLQASFVKQFCVEQHPSLPLYQPEKPSSPEFLDSLASHNADIFVVVAYGAILRQKLIDLPSCACINLHTSLLPKYRGAAPIQRAIMEGEKETGVSIMHIVRQLDAGDVIRFCKVEIGSRDTFETLQEKLYIKGAPLLYKVIDELHKGQAERYPQDDNLSSYAHKIEAQDACINWKKTAEEIDRQIRALYPEVCAWCQMLINGQDKRVKIKEAEPLGDCEGKVGEVLERKGKNFVVATGKGALRIKRLQVEGKKEMDAASFICGFASQKIELES